jgi:hypothetical protein
MHKVIWQLSIQAQVGLNTLLAPDKMQIEIVKTAK